MHFRYLFLVSFLSVALSDAPAWSAESVRVYDCVRFDENFRNIIVDSDCLVRGLRNGADPNWIHREKGKQSWSTLFNFVFWVSRSDDPKTIAAGTEAVQTLVAAGAKLQAEDTEILFWAISGGKLSLVRILLELGANASAWPNPTKMGTELTPVEKAAAKGHNEIVNLLVKNGAVRPSAETVLLERFVETANFGSIEDLAALIRQGAPINGKNRNNETVLINALSSTVLNDCEALAKIWWLLRNGADANLEGGSFGMRTRPLHYAVRIGATLYRAKRETVCAEQILRELIKGGARVAARDLAGRIPLHIAAEHNHLAAARLLLELGSTVMPRDDKGRTPLDMAESSEMIALLKKYGATER
jgi:Ankyrin repeats (3 copies)